MNVSCPSCKTRYSVDDSRVPPTGVTIRCPKCSHTFVAKRPDAGAAPPGASAVALPGSVADGGAGPPSRPASAVALPGSVGEPPPPKRSGDVGVDGDLDLGLDETPPPGRRATPTNLPGPRASDAPAQSFDDGVLDFIDDTAQRAGGGDKGRPSSVEFKVRRRNGRIDGPFGVGRIAAMIQNKELQGGEDISEDGVQWRAMTSQPDLNRVLNEAAAAAENVSFSNVDLVMPRGTDLPGTRDMPDLAGPRRNAPPPSGAMGAGSGLDLDVGGPPSAPSRPAAARTPSSMDDLMDDLDLDDDLPDDDLGGLDDEPRGDHPEVPPEGRAPRGPADDLEVGEIPELPPIWQTYRKPILVFAGIAALVLAGVFTHLFTPCGPFGVMCAYEAITAKAPPPEPPKPPPPPPKVADPKEIAGLIDQGSYEAFRSVFATIEQAGPTLPDNMLAIAKARGFATLAYGAEVFPLTELTQAVEALNTVDLAKAMGGNAAAANIEILKARSALEILTAQAVAAEAQLTGLLEQRSDDKEIALLLGLAKKATKDNIGALEALDRAIISDPKYAPALHAIGDVVLRGEDNAKEDAAIWYQKALDAEPAHGRSGVAVVAVYGEIHRYGERRRALAKTGREGLRGLLPDQVAPLLLDAVEDYDAAGRIVEVADLAQEGARLEPANPKHVAAAAVALSATGRATGGLALADSLLSRSPNDVDVRIARARIYNTSEDIAKGFLDLAEARKAAPKDYRIPLWEGRFHLSLGKMTDARAALARAIRFGTEAPGPSVELGRLDLSEGDVDAAFEHASNAVKIDPYDARSHVLFGDCLTARGELDRALKTYELARKLDDELLEGQLGYANTLRELGAKTKNPAASEELAEAIPTYLAVLEDRPGNPQVLFEYGRALELTGDIAAAMALYREASALDEKDVRPHLKMVAANLDKQPPDLESAQKSLKRADLIETHAGKPTAEVAYWQARVALAENRVHDAVSAMRNAVETEPKNAEFAYWMGRVLERNNSLYEAITYYEKATKLNSRLAKAHRALGWTAVERHQFEKARAAFDRYRESAPDDPSIYFDIGESYTRQNMDDEAMKAFDKAVRANPKHAEALLQMGNILSRQGDDKKAIKYFERAVRAKDDLAEAWCQLGIASSHRQLDKTARRALQRCVASKMAPDDMKTTATRILETR